MKFEPPLVSACLIRRYKRFLADVELPDGSILTMHCPNTGAMTNCAEPGSRVWYSTSNNIKRKYPQTFELVEFEHSGHIAGINTQRANQLVKEGIVDSAIKELCGYRNIFAERKYGDENSRIDFVLTNGGDVIEPHCYVEVKSVTLDAGDGQGLFPDAVTSRGLKHLRELVKIKSAGHRAVLLFCVQHTGIDRVSPAGAIDPEYAQALRYAVTEGVEVLAYKASISQFEIKLEKSVPVELDVDF